MGYYDDDNAEKVAAKIAAFAGMFETRKRDGTPGREGADFVCLKDGAPEWARDLVRDAHGTNFLPDDTRYEMIRDAAQDFAERLPENYEDELDEIAYTLVSVYTADRVAWLASAPLKRQEYADQAIEECGPPESLDSLLGMAWYLEAREVASAILEGARSLVEEDAEDDE